MHLPWIHVFCFVFLSKAKLQQKATCWGEKKRFLKKLCFVASSLKVLPLVLTAIPSWEKGSFYLPCMWFWKWRSRLEQTDSITLFPAVSQCYSVQTLSCKLQTGLLITGEDDCSNSYRGQHPNQLCKWQLSCSRISITTYKTWLRFWLTVFWRQKIHPSNCILAQQHEKVNTSRCQSPTDFPFSNYCSPARKVSHRCCAFWTADLQLLLSGNKGHIGSVLTGEVQYNMTQESMKIGAGQHPNCSVICTGHWLTCSPQMLGELDLLSVTYNLSYTA